MRAPTNAAVYALRRGHLNTKRMRFMRRVSKRRETGCPLKLSASPSGAANGCGDGSGQAG